MTEGGGWGEEFRHNRAITNNGRPRRYERIEITQQKIILFLFDLNFRRAFIKINKENFFAGWQSMSKWSATAGMTSLFRVLSKKCSNFVQKTLCRIGYGEKRDNHLGVFQWQLFVRLWPLHVQEFVAFESHRHI